MTTTPHKNSTVCKQNNSVHLQIQDSIVLHFIHNNHYKQIVLVLLLFQNKQINKLQQHQQ